MKNSSDEMVILIALACVLFFCPADWRSTAAGMIVLFRGIVVAFTKKNDTADKSYQKGGPDREKKYRRAVFNNGLIFSSLMFINQLVIPYFDPESPVLLYSLAAMVIGYLVFSQRIMTKYSD